MINYNNVCCNSMDSAITNEVISHSTFARDYNIVFAVSRGYKAGRCIEISHCPWCGIFLGKPLNSEYFDILEKEYGIEIPDLENFTNVPEEFRTDEWWKKRGL